MMVEMICAGFGGQGVLTTGLILAEAGMKLGMNVLWYPSYGSEMRGGTANCTVKFSDKEIASPCAKKIDILMGMNAPAIDKFESSLRPGGLLLVNSSLVHEREYRDDIRVVKVPMTEIAAEHENPKGANIVMMGAMAANSDLFTEDDLDIAKAQRVLDRDHYGLKKVKDRILEVLAVRKLAPDVKGQIICLVGPPGVGKTSIARSIAESLNRKYVRISLGGVRDEAEIRGHRRTYIGAMPGKIINAMISAKSSNPLMLLDEIDKLAGDFRGDPAAALLEALDPEQNSTFNDHFIDMPFDLSHVLFITTANDLGAIPGPLRDRMDVIELPSYTRVEKYNIARKHLVPKQLDACGLTGKVTFSQSALYGIIDGYTREAGVRNLERTITSVLRKCARKIASGEAENVSVTGTGLEKLLGPRMVKPEFLNRTNAIGIANGLAWTSIGGETLPIEVQVIDNGSGKITVTGSLGDVMKESAQLAITYARVHAAEYGIDSERLKKCDLHIHAPEGAVPKDGPSAGVTLTTALISCLSGIPVRGDVAMTGEITLHGNVLPIGGLREKSMAAYREGMKTVLIPKDNVSDLYEVDDEVKKNIEFLPMSNLSQVLAAALLKPKTVSAGHPRTRKVKPAETAALPQPAEKPQSGAVC